MFGADWRIPYSNCGVLIELSHSFAHWLICDAPLCLFTTPMQQWLPSPCSAGFSSWVYLCGNCLSCVCLICVLMERTCSQPSAVDGGVMLHGINLLWQVLVFPFKDASLFACSISKTGETWADWFTHRDNNTKGFKFNLSVAYLQWWEPPIAVC